ncbi:NifB/NifX family molybdenum-iron cluster-binding protein [Mariprofundus ferrooxydans]|uniref:NifB/NifX family molybdenum-iron cluster-binding protein n=1 Tax=Mariprofundus ferrooxydans TaxID=314344 RepID=UPI00036C25F4|nr:NifB/NifX family molybdenum-iron cluster-binding protein [Mariprofundus ferrooxydans]
MQLQRQLRVVDPMADTGALLKVAFATTDMKQVNQHFGSAKSFAIYALNEEQFTLLEVAQFGRLAQDGNEDKLAVKMAALKGCAAVYSQAMGSSAVQQLLRMNIQPIRVEAGSNITTLIKTLQDDIHSGATGWVAKAMSAHTDTNRFDQMADEGWEE